MKPLIALTIVVASLFAPLVAYAQETIVYVPVVTHRSTPETMPPYLEGQESWLGYATDKIIPVGGAPGTPWEFMRATWVVTAIDATQEPPIMWVCYYGVFADGSNAARCDKY
jgi:hypothetical protein